ncbi:MAG: prepilin-type N-terminal cleavage/methylation domain-containing protein [Acidobacteriaceae bacterium]|nr:prepilin-type N-terminal cleavage/methylation domain-containing protein [Acidobacteriaceae bacterium]
MRTDSLRLPVRVPPLETRSLSGLSGRDAAAGKESGFTLLEAIVAVALLAAVLVPIYTLIGTTLHSAFHLGEVNRMNEVQSNALEALSAVNPMVQPTGDLDLGPYRLHWESQLVRGPADGSGYPRGTSLYQLGLYDMAVSVLDASGASLTSFTVRQVGSQQIRNLTSPFSAGSG